MKIKIAHHRCPICGFPDFEALENGLVTYEICPSCGAESGDEYNAEEDDFRLAHFRQKWFIQKKGTWWSTVQKPPNGWDARAQLIRAGFEIPKE